MMTTTSDFANEVEKHEGNFCTCFRVAYVVQGCVMYPQMIFGVYQMKSDFANAIAGIGTYSPPPFDVDSVHAAE
uniref:Uncharacterized protein n=1 Tax=Cucumis sativus TaxID=3659 RepID=A0A0A0K6E7_CUCSA